MLIRCIRCKKQFVQKTYERQCGCRKHPKFGWVDKHPHYNRYIERLRLRFQDPRYQYHRLQHSEYLTYDSRNERSKMNPHAIGNQGWKHRKNLKIKVEIPPKKKEERIEIIAH